MKHRFTLVLTLLASLIVGCLAGVAVETTHGLAAGIGTGLVTTAFSANFMLIPWAAGGWSHSLGFKGVVYDDTATNYAHQIAPDYTSSLAELMAPQCVQPAAHGQYIAFDDDEAFRYVETRRAMGGDMAMIELPAESPRFACEPHALGIPTDKFEYELVGEKGRQQLRESKIRTLISRNALSREKRVFDAYAAGTTPLEGAGDWTDPTADPIDEINSIIVRLATNTGQSRIDLVVGLLALQQMAKHPKIMARRPGADVVDFNAGVLARMLLIPVNVHIATLPIALEKRGKAASKQIIAGDKIYALISQKNPSPYDPSAAKTFTTHLGQVTGVGFVEKPPFAEVNFLAWSEDIKMTGTQCVERIDVETGDIEVEGGE